MEDTFGLDRVLPLSIGLDAALPLSMMNYFLLHGGYIC